MAEQVDAGVAAILFEEARTHQAWTGRPVPEELLVELYRRLRWAPTSINSNPGRFVFVKSPEGKQRLAAHLMPMNVEKTLAAPVCAIVAKDVRFYEFIPQLLPGRPIKAGAETNLALAESTAARNATLQGAYLILAARSLGLDCGPMSGFDAPALNKAFFDGTTLSVNFLCNLGYGDASKLFPRSPRFDFGDACSIA